MYLDSGLRNVEPESDQTCLPTLSKAKPITDSSDQPGPTSKATQSMAFGDFWPVSL